MNEDLIAIQDEHKASFFVRLSRSLQSSWKSIVVAIPFFWLLFFFLVPFLIVLKISVAEALIASPPFSPLLDWSEDGIVMIRLVFDNFTYLWEDDLRYNLYQLGQNFDYINSYMFVDRLSNSLWHSPLSADYEKYFITAHYFTVLDFILT